MPRFLPPWVIDDADRTQPRQRSERRPRLEMPRPPKLARSLGDEPEAAQVIIVVHLLGSSNPPLRTRITRQASVFPFLRWLLPASAFEAGARRGFNLDPEGF